MAREILFKAKRIDNGEWEEGYYCKYGYVGKEKHYIIPIYASDLYAFEIDTNTLCQYTGLTDKNGNKIWENDVVKYPAYEEIFKVIWDSGNCEYMVDSEWGSFGLGYYIGYDLEVIGNVFDNPELLGGGE